MACKKSAQIIPEGSLLGDAANPGVNTQKNASETIRTESEIRIFKYTIKKLLLVMVSISVELLMVSGKAHDPQCSKNTQSYRKAYSSS